MTNELISTLSGAVIGALIAGFFGWLLPNIHNKNALKQKKKFFSMAIADDLSKIWGQVLTTYNEVYFMRVT